MERTLVLVKPDGVEKNLIGAVISRFESAGLKVIALKMLVATKGQAGKHYILEKQWYENMWANSKKAKEAAGQKMTETPLQMGLRVRKTLMKFLTSGPIVAMVVEGNDAISEVRKMAGATSPSRADPKSIRGMYSNDSYDKADREKRALKNILHASDSVRTANRETKVWFAKREIVK